MLIVNKDVLLSSIQLFPVFRIFCVIEDSRKRSRSKNNLHTREQTDRNCLIGSDRSFNLISFISASNYLSKINNHFSIENKRKKLTDAWISQIKSLLTYLSIDEERK